MFDSARDNAVHDESLLQAGELRQTFAAARAEARGPRWLVDVSVPAEGDVDLRLAELRERERRVEQREQAVARWFRDLSRAQRRLEDERRALETHEASL
jgi:hypothetical protein